MSLREFKRTLQTCSAGTGAATSTTTTTITRKLAPFPKKSSLREQLASIERLAADLDCTPLGDSLPPPLKTSSPRKSLQKEEPQETQRGETAFSSSSSSQHHRSDPIDAFSSFASKVPPLKRRRLSDYADLVIRGGSGDLNDVQLSQPFSEEKEGLATTKEDLPLLKSHYIEEADEQGEEKEEEEGCLPISPGDSEAGLFIQSQTEGLHEPLVLWPSGGQGCLQVAEMVQVPSSINSRLLEHQRAGVRFLYSLYRENKGGVLGDDMGLGKTIQVIALLSAILPHTVHSFRADYNEKSQKLKKLVLIICPTSVLRNWEQEFHAWGSFAVAIYHGTSREVVLRRLESQSLQIVLTSFDTFRIHGECLCVVDWNCVIVDEAHRLKNDRSDLYKACVKIRTMRRYGLTGTIMQNKIIDLFNVFDWVAPGCLGTREHFREFYEDPLKQGQRISAPEKFIRVAEERKLHLAKVLQRYLLRREKQETIGHLMMGKEDNVIFCEMSSLQHRAYKRLLASPDFQSLIKKDEPCSCGSPLTRAECCYRIVPSGIIWPYLHRENTDGCDSCPNCLVLPCLMKLQQVSNHLELIKPNVKDDLEKQKKDALLARFILAEDASLLGGLTQDESFLGLSDAQHCGKMRALEQLLSYWVPQGDKVLLFSYSVRMLDILDKFLIRKGYCFCRLDGSTPMSMRQSMVDDFNRSPSKQVFLISTRAGGLGLNLVSANRVVIFDPNWNPAQDLQAQDRSFRYGQRRHVIVYRLLAAGSLEELVYSRQIYKQQLFNIAVSGNLEKRYFEGVQDSKENKGELFGIGNLFRDLSEKAFTSEIIETYDKRVLTITGRNGRENRMVGKDLHQNLCGGHVSRAAKEGEATASAGEGAVPVGAGVVSASNSRKQNCMVKQSSEDELSRVLKDAGVIYAHRYEDVVNCKPRMINGEDGGSHAGKSAQRSDHALCPLQPNKPKRTAVNVTRGLSTQLKKDQCSSKKPGKPLNEETKRFSNSMAVASKEEQFAHLATFKGMSKTSFCKWLLSASEAEKQKLLLDVKQAKV